MVRKPDKNVTMIRRAGALVLAALSLGTMGTAPVKALASLPAVMTVPVGQAVALPWSTFLPITLAAGPGLQSRTEGARAAVVASRPGPSSIGFRLFGRIPVGRVPVRAVVAPKVVPGGQSIGVVVRVRGVVVTGYHVLNGPFGSIDPARAAGIMPGDRLTSADGRALTSAAELMRMAEQAGEHDQSLTLRDAGVRGVTTRVVKPVYNPVSGHYQIGVYVRTQASGVGTLTFWNPQTLGYAALGHSITDGLTARPAPLRSGSLTAASVLGIVPGTASRPGEKIGVMAGPGLVSGTVRANGRFGLTGQLDRPPAVGPHTPVPVAMAEQVHPGPASIETVIAGNRPQRFGIRILATYPQTAPATKGILFQVTDRRLLARAGGIVQGMSGSPILQDGKLVGAVTHVFVGRSDVGYGCYAEWMLQDVP